MRNISSHRQSLVASMYRNPSARHQCVLPRLRGTHETLGVGNTNSSVNYTAAVLVSSWSLLGSRPACHTQDGTGTIHPERRVRPLVRWFLMALDFLSPAQRWRSLNGLLADRRAAPRLRLFV